MNKIAVLIDADNASPKLLDVMDNYINSIKEESIVTISRAYGNWQNKNLKGWSALIAERAITAIQAFDLTANKNATDIRLVIDCMDIIHHKDVSSIILLTSDCDFTPLATRVRESGVSVIGIGESKTPKPFRFACNKFITADMSKVKKEKYNITPEIMKKINKIIANNKKKKGLELIKLSDIGTILSESALNPHKLGFKNLKGLMEFLGYKIITKGLVIYIRI